MSGQGDYTEQWEVRHYARGLHRLRDLLCCLSRWCSATESVCYGDNFYGSVPNDQVEQRIQMRADQFPCEDVVVYCISCIRAMTAGGKTAYYLPNLLLDRTAESMPDTLDEYHEKLMGYIEKH